MGDRDATRLLLVEDEAIIALAEKALLERNGFSVVTANSGEKALAAVKEDREIDLVLMDIDLGAGITGEVAAQRILEIRDLPVVFLTSHTERDFVERVKGITRYGYVVKHAGEFVLMESISMALELFKAHQATREREARIAQLNRTYQVLSDVNQTIVREGEEAPLLESICEIAVEKGDFRFAWVCSPDEAGRGLLRRYYRGEEESREAPVFIDLENPTARKGPTARAFLTGEPTVIEDTLEEPKDAPWRAFSLTHGVRSVAAFPIRLQGIVAYLLTLYAPEPAFFDEKELSLLEELVMDVEFALQAMENDRMRAAAEKERKEWEELMDFVIRHDPNAITILDSELRHIYVSDRFCRDYKVSRQEVLGRHHYDVFPEVPERWREVHARALTGEVLSSDDDHFVRQDGSVDYTRWECRPWYRGEEIGGIILYTEVVNELKEAEATERAVLGAMEALLANSPYLVSILDAEGRYWMVSDSVARSIGRPKEEIIGKSLEEVLPAAVASSFRNSLEEVLSGGRNVTKVDDVPVNSHTARFQTSLFPAQRVNGKVTLVGVMSFEAER